MGKTTTDQRRIHGGYSQKKGPNLERKLESQRRRPQGGAEETRRKDDGNNKDKQQAFYNNQLKRYVELLNIIKKKEI